MKKKTLKERLKSYITLSLVFAMYVSILPSVSYSAIRMDSGEKVKFLNRIGISAVYDENAYITRGDFATLALQASANIDDVSEEAEDLYYDDVTKEQAAYINVATSLGYVYGTQERMFHPDEIITTDEALSICMRILGWSSIEGYQASQAMASFRAELLKGVGAGGDLTCANATRLLFNMLNSRYIDMTVIKGDSPVYEYSANTYMNEYFGIYEGTGIVGSIGGMYINGAECVDLKQAVIGGVTLDNSYYRDAQWLGLKVKYYALNVDYGCDEILYLEASGSDNSYEFGTSEVEAINGFDANDSAQEKENPQITYKKDGKSNKTLRIDPLATIIKNGANVVGVTNEDFTYDDGRIILTDSDDDNVYDIVIIEQFVYYRVHYYDADQTLLVDKRGKESIDFEKLEDYEDRIVYDGAAVGTSALVPDAILKVLCSYKEDGSIDYAKNFTIEVMPGKITGVLDSVDGSENIAIVDGKEYRMLKSLDLANVDLGMSVIFYIGDDEVIVDYDIPTFTELAKYAYIREVVYDEDAPEPEAVVRLFTEDEKMESYPLSEEFRYTGYYNDNYVYNRKIKHEKVKEYIAPKQLAKFNVADGKLTKLETAYDRTNEDADYDGYDEEHFSLNYKGSTTFYNANVTDNYTCTDDTKVFYVPSDVTKKDEFSCGNWLTYGYNRSVENVKVYDVNKSLRPKALVITEGPDKFKADEFLYYRTFCVVTKNKVVLNEDDEVITVIEVDANGGSIELRAKKEGLAPVQVSYFRDRNGKKTRTNARVKAFEDLQPGDVITYLPYPDGTVNVFTVLTEYDKEHKKTLFEYDLPRSENPSPFLASCQSITGRVKKVVPNSNIRIEGVEEYLLPIGVGGVRYYIMENGKITYTSFAEPHINEGDYVYALKRGNNVVMMIIYR